MVLLKHVLKQKAKLPELWNSILKLYSQKIWKSLQIDITVYVRNVLYDMLEGKLGKIKVQYCAENEANVFSDFGILCFKLIELINASSRQMGV